jgi:hypothetical protein
MGVKLLHYSAHINALYQAIAIKKESKVTGHSTFSTRRRGNRDTGTKNVRHEKWQMSTLRVLVGHRHMDFT